MTWAVQYLLGETRCRLPMVTETAVLLADTINSLSLLRVAHASTTRWGQSASSYHGGRTSLARLALPPGPGRSITTMASPANLTQDGTFNYTWGAENRLVGMHTGDLASPQTNDKWLEFKYDYMDP